MDIVVTTPKREMKNAALEAAAAIGAGGSGYYFRRFPRLPKGLQVGDRIYYAEDGFIRGFAIIDHIEKRDYPQFCDGTGREYPAGFYVWMPAMSWKWCRPVISCEGFRGFRYARSCFTEDMVEVVGDWLADKPLLPHEEKVKC